MFKYFLKRLAQMLVTLFIVSILVFVLANFMVPSMLDLPQGCYFAPRCKYCQDICRTVTPENHEVSPGHCAACHFPLTGGESHE